MKLLFLLGKIFFLLAGINSISCANKIMKRPGESVVVEDLTVMTYNIHHANPPLKPGVIDLEAIAKVILEQGPDLVALQEVDVYTGRSGANLHEAEKLGLLTGMKVYFAKAIDFDGGEYGVAILSKFPMSDMQNVGLPTAPETNGEPRTLATVTITLPGNHRILFACTRLDAQPNDTNLLLQINKILEMLKKEKLPIIIAGDFNAVPASRIINALDSYFIRSCQDICPGTIPVDVPSKAIDFIAYAPSSKFRVKGHKVINEKYASDHLPVVAAFHMNF